MRNMLYVKYKMIEYFVNISLISPNIIINGGLDRNKPIEMNT